jgi:hypothetical protein
MKSNTYAKYRKVIGSAFSIGATLGATSRSEGNQVTLSLLAIVIGSAMIALGVIQLVAHGGSPRLFRRRTSIPALVANSDIRLIGAGLLFILVGYLAA